MDRTTGIDAATWLADRSERELSDVLTRFGEERFARRIARAIVSARQSGPVLTTGQLASIVRRAVPYGGRQRIDPATRTFQALRIAVNAELEGLDTFATDAVSQLVPGGRLGVISFHSLEDRIVKHTFRAMAAEGAVRLVTKKPVTPESDEIERNPRARSAKFRVAERSA